MKTCKKCKKAVSNNTKICKYCGADLTKTKSKNNISKNKDKVEKLKKVDTELKLSENKTEFLYTSDYKTEILNEQTEILENIVLDQKVEDNTEVSNEEKKLKFKNLKVSKLNVKKDQKNKIKDQLKEFFSEEYKKEAEDYNILGNKKINSNNKKDFEILNDSNQKYTKAEQIFLTKKHLERKKIVKIIILLIFLFSLCYVFYKVYNFYGRLGYVIKEDELGQRNNFIMGETITYKNISYKVIKVETSVGTAYKKPKEGNQYLIVTINLKNNADEKYHYSSEDFTMINSNLEETNRIISPVNAGTALYSGNLVVGATKEASLVFEQPIGDQKLYLLYYDPDDIKYYEEQLKNQVEIDDESNTEKIEIDDESNTEKIKLDIPKPKPIFKVKIESN